MENKKSGARKDEKEEREGKGEIVPPFLPFHPFHSFLLGNIKKSKSKTV
jgi:hypothetical protein